MNAIVSFRPVHPERYRAVKEAVRERCEFLRLCPAATQQCIDRGAKTLREGRSAGVSIAEGIKLAKRLALIADGGWAPSGDAA